jgi:hypothetical protein
MFALLQQAATTPNVNNPNYGGAAGWGWAWLWIVLAIIVVIALFGFGGGWYRNRRQPPRAVP